MYLIVEFALKIILLNRICVIIGTLSSKLLKKKKAQPSQ